MEKSIILFYYRSTVFPGTFTEQILIKYVYIYLGGDRDDEDHGVHRVLHHQEPEGRQQRPRRGAQPQQTEVPAVHEQKGRIQQTSRRHPLNMDLNVIYKTRFCTMYYVLNVYTAVRTLNCTHVTST